MAPRKSADGCGGDDGAKVKRRRKIGANLPLAALRFGSECAASAPAPPDRSRAASLDLGDVCERAKGGGATATDLNRGVPRSLPGARGRQAARLFPSGRIASAPRGRRVPTEPLLFMMTDGAYGPPERGSDHTAWRSMHACMQSMRDWE
eukprot:325071-Chlamydomonas_euryale.AAC.4